MKKQTVKDLEAKTGQHDSIRNADGSNSRSDKQVETLQKQAAKLATKHTLPEEVPNAITLHYADGRTRTIVDESVKAVAAYLHALEQQE